MDRRIDPDQEYIHFTRSAKPSSAFAYISIYILLYRYFYFYCEAFNKTEVHTKGLKINKVKYFKRVSSSIKKKGFKCIFQFILNFSFKRKKT